MARILRIFHSKQKLHQSVPITLASSEDWRCTDSSIIYAHHKRQMQGHAVQ